MSESNKENKTKRRDGFTNALGGVNSGSAPNLLDANQVWMALNVSMRGGYPETRPGFNPITYHFDTAEQKAWWETHNPQKFAKYESTSGNMIVNVVGGRFFLTDPLNHFMTTEITPTRAVTTNADFTSPAIGGSVNITVTDSDKILVGYPIFVGDGYYTVTAITGNVLTATNNTATALTLVPSGNIVTFLDPNNPDNFQVYSAQIDKFLIFQNGASLAVIFNGVNCTRTEIGTGIPVGTSMVEHNSRLWVAIGDEVAAGDIIISGDAQHCLHFTEEKAISGGGRFRVKGQITAMVVAPALDTSLGQGPLLVMTKDTFNTFNLPLNRDLWSTITQPIQTIGLEGFGPLGQESVVVINSDVFYRAKDGIRSFVMARREFYTWGNVPLSREMTIILNDETHRLRGFMSATLFDNRFLFGVTPLRYMEGIAAKGLGVLDFDLLSAMGKKSNPVYDGLWSGLIVYQLLTMDVDDEERCFVYAREEDGKLGAWEISKDANFDDNDQPISCYVEFRAMNFGSAFEFKKLQSAKLWVDRYMGTVSFTLKWRPDDAPCFFEWGKRTFCNTLPCATGDCYTMQTPKFAYVSRKGFGQPPDVCEQVDQKSARFAYEFQPRLEWVGRARIKRLLLAADEDQDRPISDCD